MIHVKCVQASGLTTYLKFYKFTGNSAYLEWTDAPEFAHAFTGPCYAIAILKRIKRNFPLLNVEVING